MYTVEINMNREQDPLEQDPDHHDRKAWQTKKTIGRGGHVSADDWGSHFGCETR